MNKAKKKFEKFLICDGPNGSVRFFKSKKYYSTRARFCLNPEAARMFFDEATLQHSEREILQSNTRVKNLREIDAAEFQTMAYVVRYKGIKREPAWKIAVDKEDTNVFSKRGPAEACLVKALRKRAEGVKEDIRYDEKSLKEGRANLANLLARIEKLEGKT